ncbi:MAG: excinuclease subunit [Thermoplasmata archaeon]|jgi:excinuclease ABC subunit C|nr:excinuclease subunit [Thermoplasmata archaeon]
MRVPVSPALQERVARLSRGPGVYQWKDATGTILYVGKAVDLRSRVSSYLDPTTPKTARLMEDVADLDFIAVRTEKEALLLEQTLIKLHRPRYNVRLNDDKQYPYLKLTREPYPRLLKVHRREADGATYFGPFPDGTGAWHVLQAIQDLVPLRRCRVLPKEKCLYYDIGKCVAPCIDACTDHEYDLLVAEVRDLLEGRSGHLVGRVQARMEAAAEAQRFEEAARLRDQLSGLRNVLDRQHMVADRLEDRDVAAMAVDGDLGVVVVLHQRDGKVVGQSPFIVTGAAADEQDDHPLVAFLRGYYQDIPVPRNLAIDAPDPVAAPLEADLRLLRGGAVTVESPQKGDKRRWIEVARTNAALRLTEELHRRSRRGQGALEALQRALALPVPPRVVEGFDISHLAGDFTRAAMVRFVDGEPDKAGYRTFNMKLVGEAAVAAGTAASKGAGREVDDFASMGEAVGRRYRGVLERGEPLPDLVLVDGGPGQLNAAREALRGLALLHLPVCSLAKEEELVHIPGRLKPLRMARSDPALQLLQRVRDEAHRFGIQQVQRKSTQSVVSSPLDDVPGIGPKRRAELVTAFGGLEGLRAASLEELQKVRGVTPAVAAAIQAALRGPDEAVPAPPA